MTQGQLAERTGNICTQENISKLERGDATGSEFTVQLADACGVRPQWLAMEQGDMVDGVVIDDPRLKAALSDPKKVNVLLLMEPLPTYAIDHVLRDVTEIAQLIDQAKVG